MASIAKRIKNKVQADVDNALVNPSIKSIVDIRRDLTNKEAEEQTESNQLESKVSQYKTLAKEWKNRKETAEQALKRYPEMSEVARGEMESLLETADSYCKLYENAHEQATEALATKKDVLQRIKNTIEELKSHERKFTLQSSLKETSRQLNTAFNADDKRNEAREVIKTVHVAKALMELKEGEKYHG